MQKGGIRMQEKTQIILHEEKKKKRLAVYHSLCLICWIIGPLLFFYYIEAIKSYTYGDSLLYDSDFVLLCLSLFLIIAGIIFFILYRNVKKIKTYEEIERNEICRQQETVRQQQEALLFEHEQNLIKSYAKKKELAGVKEDYRILDLFRNPFFIWRCDDSLCLFPGRFDMKDQFVSYIKINDILYFTVEGQVWVENQVYGGGGGGSNIGGAIVGGLIAGAPGAIIGSRNKINDIYSQSIKHDERKTILQLKEGRFYFTLDSYEILNFIIPDKNLNYINSTAAQSLTPQK